MKITIEYYDHKLTIEEPDDLTCDTLLRDLIGAMYVLGFHPTNIKDDIIELAQLYEDSSH